MCLFDSRPGNIICVFTYYYMDRIRVCVWCECMRKSYSKRASPASCHICWAFLVFICLFLVTSEWRWTDTPVTSSQQPTTSIWVTFQELECVCTMLAQHSTGRKCGASVLRVHTDNILEIQDNSKPISSVTHSIPYTILLLPGISRRMWRKIHIVFESNISASKVHCEYSHEIWQ